MKRLRKITRITIRIIPVPLILFALCVFNTVKAQTTYQTTGPVKITILGTSNIHDWEMNAEKGNSTAVFITDGNGSLSSLASLSFTMPVEGLKSEHTAMDKNAYKAMRTEKYNAITFTAANAAIKPVNNGYQIISRGKLTISGVSRDVDVTAICNVNPDKSITVNGAYKLKMTAYNVTPPSIMFGTIKTGDDITVKFNLLFKAAR